MGNRRYLISTVAALALFATPAIADYAPLNCAKAGTVTERVICTNYELGQAEARVATLYDWSTAFVAMGQRGDIADAQREFLKTRGACKANIRCLRNAYDARIKELDAVMTRIKEKGPF
ncbi:MAG TPA: hypothetical protein VM867_00985 [Xanthobacteraceae bacterium]|nr:hypothetical protein [Xanthobacteraceae bacterium]